ncbi:MAG TPA: hypothetical protein VNA69_19715 [Thermoanaerobaculia bacterium]|nr:hypothetical protein [Thermoanaerobaculia bacterium]
MVDHKTFVFDHCSWCGGRVSQHEQIPLGVPLEIGPEESVLLGCAVEFGVDGYVLTGFLFPIESEEKREGFDLGMIACGDECADEAMLRAGRAGIRLQPLSEASVRLKMLRA